jgi:hypothetical protein
MGTELLVGLALSAAGTGLKAYDEHQVLKKQDREVARGIAAQSAIADRANQRVTGELAGLQASTPESEQAASTAAFMQQLRANQKQAEGAQTVGATSDRYNADTAAAKTAVQAYGADKAENAAAIRAPVDQRTGESAALSRMGSDLSSLERKSASEAFMAQLRAKAVRSNPWLQGLGSLMQAAGTVYGGTGGATAGAGAGSAATSTGTALSDWATTGGRALTRGFA